jgi:hypothetical protein
MSTSSCRASGRANLPISEVSWRGLHGEADDVQDNIPEPDVGSGQGDDEAEAGGAEGVEGASVAGYSAMEEDSVAEHHPAEAPEAIPEPEEPVVPVVPDEVAPPHRYPKRDRHPPSEWYRVNKARLHALKGLTDNPATYKEAMQRPDKDLWQQVIDEELRALHEKRVYTEVNPPDGVTPLPSKLVLNIKRDEDGNVEKCKARLVAKGFKQIAGRDFDEMFAPTAQHVTLLLAVASQKGLDIGQLDVKTAFLNGDLPGDIYLKLPNEVGGVVWKLHKALYGLKQAARAWHAKLRDAMIDHGFTPSQP